MHPTGMHSSCVHSLVEAGACVNEASKGNKIPLKYSSMNCVVEMLTEEQADVNS